MKNLGESYGYIYVTVNMINGKKYIGQKKFDRQGKWKTYIGSGIAFKHAVKKHGAEHFKTFVIDYANSPEELNDLENKYTVTLNCVKSKNYYNLVEGGGTVTGLKFSKKTLDRLGELATGENNYFYGKQYFGIENGFYGKSHTLESRKAMSEQHKGQVPWSKGRVNVFSEESLTKMRNAKLGKKLSKSHKAAIANAQQGENHPMYGKKHSNKTKALMREKALGRKASDETRKKMSESQIKRAADKTNVIKHHTRYVKCTTTGVVFKSILEACEYANLKSSSSIIEVCKGNNKTAGRLNGTKLEWEYVD